MLWDATFMNCCKLWVKESLWCFRKQFRIHSQQWWGNSQDLHNSEGPELVVFTPALFIRPLARRGGLGGRNLDKLSSLLPAIVTDAVQVLKHFRLPHKYNRSAHIEAYSLTIYVIKPFAVNSPQSPWWYQRDLLWRAITMGNMSGWSKT